MKTVLGVEAHIDDLQIWHLGFPEKPDDPEDDGWIFLDPSDDNFEANIKKAVEVTSLSPLVLKQLVDAFQSVIENIQEEIGKDLKEIWLRLDELERKK